jgi:hypothetical protein
MKAIASLGNPKFNYPYKGFCSIVNQLIDICYEHYKQYNNFEILIKDEYVGKLFDFLYFGESLYDASDIWLEKFFSDNLSYSFNAHTEANVDFLKSRNYVFERVLKIKKEKVEYFENILKKQFLSKNNLGIQIRGTDKKTELPEPNNEKIIFMIDDYIKNKKIENIFLSTDDEKYLNLLKNTYGDIVKYNNKNFISTDGHPIHFKFDKHTINEQVLSDVYLLSKCEHFLYCYSNVSYLALTMGINNFKSIGLIN